MHTVIFTGGKLTDGKPVRQALASADSVIAADSGALSALDMGVTPSVVIGDFDSLDTKHQAGLKAKGTKLIAHPVEKDKTDTELAIDYAVEEGAKHITILGGIEGNRIDHILANVFVVNGHDTPIRLINGETTVWRIKEPRTELISGSAGDRLSLLPLTQGVGGITTSGLKYALKDGLLKMGQSRGVSNVMTRKQASVTWARGVLLFVHDERPK